MKRQNIALSIATTAAILSGPTYAQTVAEQDNNQGVADIIVTASKREESINKVGATVTALSAAALQERRIVSLEDVAAAVPGLSFAPSEVATPIFTLRGIGFNESSLGAYPAVSTYLDQAPLPFPIMSSHTAYDLERIEVLKGPQGTLFGQNSTGGAINFIAAKPTDEFEAGGDATFGRFNHFEGNAHISGPITDQLKGRFAITGVNEDGWQKSLTRPTDRNGKTSYLAGRLLLDYKPSDTISFFLNVNAWQDKSEPQAPQYVAFRPLFPADYEQYQYDQPFVPASRRLADWSPENADVSAFCGLPGCVNKYRGTNWSNRRMVQASLRTDVNLTDDISFVSLTSYNRFKQNMALEKDGSALVVSDIPKSDGDIKNFNQEVRIEQTSSNLRWVVGGNFERSDTYEDQINTYNDVSSNNPGTLFITSSGVTNKQKITNYAIFGNAEYNLTSQLVLKAGARYTESKIKDQICGYGSDNGRVADLFNGLGAAIGTVPFTPIIGGNRPFGGCNTLNDNFVPGDLFNSTLKENNVSWRVGLDYQASNDLLFYGNISRGYKAGSYPTLAAATFLQFKPVTQESVTSYEAGVKAGLFDHIAQLNAAVFYSDYKDKQVRGKIPDIIFGTLDALVNVPKSRIWGAEADLTVRPVRSLTLSGAVTYLNSRISEYSGYNVIGEIQNFVGQDIPFTPKFSYNLNADFRPELANGGTPYIGATFTGQTSRDAALGADTISVPVAPQNRVLPGLAHPFSLKGYATVDFRFGYDAADGAWGIMFWAKNAFNKLYYTNTTTSLDATVRYTGRPATYGMTVKFKTR